MSSAISNNFLAKVTIENVQGFGGLSNTTSSRPRLIPPPPWFRKYRYVLGDDIQVSVSDVI